MTSTQTSLDMLLTLGSKVTYQNTGVLSERSASAHKPS